MRFLRVSLVLGLAVLCGGVASAAGYNAGGFESFAIGDLNGQDGWVGSAAGGGVAPSVVDSPAIGQKAVKLEVPDVQGASTQMDIAIAPIAAVSGTKVTVSYDIYRPAPAGGMLAQNLWWWWFDAGEPTYGLQWDQGGGTVCPHGWNPGAGSTASVYDVFANITMVWDFTEMKAYSSYNGVAVDNGIPISNITSLTGWSINLGHDAGTGTGASLAYIDNFSIDVRVIPEPGSLLALASGLVGLGGLALRRRS